MADNKAQAKKVSTLVMVSILIGIILVIAIPLIAIVNPSPADNTITSNRSVEFFINITESNLKEVKFNWNETNFTIYDTDNLILAYNFNNLSSLGENDTIVFDISGHGNNGTVNGAIFNSSGGQLLGNYDGAYTFDNLTNNHIDTNFNRNLNTTSWAIELWVKSAHTTQAEGSDIFVKGFDYRIFQTNDGDLRFLTRNLSGDDITSSNVGNTSDLIWHHVFYTYNFSENKTYMYFDGILEDSRNQQGIVANNNKFTIGGGGGSGFEFNGSVDEVRLWNRTFNGEEVFQSYSINLKRFDTGNLTLYLNRSILSPTRINTYFSCATNSSGSENCTETRTITTGWTINVTANFTSSIGDIRESFYGVNHAVRYISNNSWLDANADGTVDTNTDYIWQRDRLQDANINYLRDDMALELVANEDKSFKTSGTGNQDNINVQKNVVEWAKENNVKIMFIAGFMPSWLINNTEGWCNSKTLTCPPKNYTRWGELVVDFLQAVDCDADTCEVEVWNEPDLAGFWMNDVAVTNAVRSIEYNKLYNITRIAVKEEYPNMVVGGTAVSSITTTGGKLIYQNWMSNFTTDMDFVSIHKYASSGSDNRFYKTDIMKTTIDDLIANCTEFGANCSRIMISEWNNEDQILKNTTSFEDEFALDLAYVYQSVLNNFQENVTLQLFQWAEFINYTEGSAFYPGHPQKWTMIAEPHLENEFYRSYNVTQDFSNSHSVGSTVFNSSSTDTFIKVVSTKNQTNYFITIINTDTEARNITINTDGLLTQLVNQETGEVFNNNDGEFQVGVLDSFGILYMGYEGASVTGLVARLKFNENIGTSAFDVTGIGGNGTILGGIWKNDAVILTLITGIDYLFTNPILTLITDANLFNFLITRYASSVARTDLQSIQGNYSRGLVNISGQFPAIGTIIGIIILIIILVGLLIFVIMKMTRASGGGISSVTKSSGFGGSGRDFS